MTFWARKVLGTSRNGPQFRPMQSSLSLGSCFNYFSMTFWLLFCLFVVVVISEKAGKSSSAESHASNGPRVPVGEVSHKCNDNHVIEDWSLRTLKTKVTLPP